MVRFQVIVERHRWTVVHTLQARTDCLLSLLHFICSYSATKSSTKTRESSSSSDEANGLRFKLEMAIQTERDQNKANNLAQPAAT